MRALPQALLLVGLACAGGLIAQITREKPLPWRQAWSDVVLDKAKAAGIRVVDLAETRIALETGGYLALDARSNKDYLAGHLPGALALPVLELEQHLPQLLPLLTPEQPIVVYCSGLACDESIELAELLKNQGYTNLVLFAGGVKAWQEAGLPLQQ